MRHVEAAACEKSAVMDRLVSLDSFLLPPARNCNRLQQLGQHDNWDMNYELRLPDWSGPCHREKYLNI